MTVKLEQKERWPALWEGKRPLSLKAKKAIRGKLVILYISHFEVLLKIKANINFIFIICNYFAPL